MPIIEAFKLFQDLSNSHENVAKVCFVTVLMTVNSELAHQNHFSQAFEVMSDERARERIGLKLRMFGMEQMDVLRASQTKM